MRTIVADWSTRDPAITNLLEKLQGSRQIPYLAIFPAGQPEKAIRFAGLYTRKSLIDALNKAGPSKAVDLTESETQSERLAEKPAVIISELP